MFWRQTDTRRMAQEANRKIRRDEFVWALGSFCALNRIPFSPELVLKEFPPPYTGESVVQAARALGFKIREMACHAASLAKLKFPCLALLREAPAPTDSATADAGELVALELTETTGEVPTAPEYRLAIVFEASAERIVYFEGNSNTPKSATPAEFAALYAGVAWLIAPQTQEAKDPDSEAQAAPKFGFKWFVPELLKHRQVWRDVLLGVGLPTPENCGPGAVAQALRRAAVKRVINIFVIAFMIFSLVKICVPFF